jgi:hypothetical protein
MWAGIRYFQKAGGVFLGGIGRHNVQWTGTFVDGELAEYFAAGV